MSAKKGEFEGTDLMPAEHVLSPVCRRTGTDEVTVDTTGAFECSSVTKIRYKPKKQRIDCVCV